MSLIRSRSKIPFLDLFVLLTVLWDNSKFAPKWFRYQKTGRLKLCYTTRVVAAGPGLWAPEPSTTFHQPGKTEFPFKTTCEIWQMLPPFCIGFWWRQLLEQVQFWNFLAQLNDWILPKLFTAWYRLYFKYKLLHLASYYPSQHISRYNNLQYSVHFFRSTFYFLF